MPARNSKGRFVKGGGKSRRRSPGGGGVVVVAAPSRAPARRSSPRKAPVKKRRRRSGGGDGVTMNKLLPYAVAGVVLGYVSGEGNVESVATTIDKIPGAKTLGRPLTIGLGCLAVNKFITRNKYLKIIGTVGTIVGAYQLGVKKLDVKWLGDGDDGGPVDDVGY